VFFGGHFSDDAGGGRPAGGVDGAFFSGDGCPHDVDPQSVFLGERSPVLGRRLLLGRPSPRLFLRAVLFLPAVAERCFFVGSRFVFFFFGLFLWGPSCSSCFRHLSHQTDDEVSGSPFVRRTSCFPSLGGDVLPVRCVFRRGSLFCSTQWAVFCFFPLIWSLSRALLPFFLLGEASWSAWSQSFWRFHPCPSQ